MAKNNLVLITGGAGFIGSHLTDALLERGFCVRVLDNLTPPTHNGKLPVWFNKKAEFIKGDVRRKNDWQKALKGASYVIHLAAYMDYHLDFSKFFDVNTKSVALLYEVIVEKNLPVKKVIVASSQSVYGEGKYFCEGHGIIYPRPRLLAQLKKGEWELQCPIHKKIMEPQAELESDEVNPQIPYGISKWAAERTAIALGSIYAIPTVALRYSIVQGARQSFRHFYSGALREFAVRALSGLPIEMQEDAGQLRDFVNVHDVIEAHIKVLGDPQADGEIFNVGSGEGTRVADLAKKVCAVAGTVFNPILKGVFRINAPRHSLMDISKLKKLGWRPRKTLKDSIGEYLAWVKNYPEAKKYLLKTYRAMARSRIIRK